MWAWSKLFLAEGLGSGRLPITPGTFGSAVGLLWCALLLASGHIGVFYLGSVLGIPLSVWLCGQAELSLGRADPGSVVLDEIIALPICFWVWIGWRYQQTGMLPELAYFLSRERLPGLLGIFLTFRLFDILKPWPIHASQRLPGGWGITADDLLAAGYVNLLVLLVLLWRQQS